MKTIIYYTLFILYLLCNTGLLGQKNIKLIVPDATTHFAFYNEFKSELKKDNKLNISELDNYPIWTMIKESHNPRDSNLVADRHGYYKGSGIDYYIEVFQIKESLDIYKNTVFLFADTVVYQFDWYAKKGEINTNLLRYNIKKINYCIYNRIKQKDLVIVTFKNSISKEDIREDFGNFPNTFVNSLKSMDSEIASKYSFNPLFTITQNDNDLPGNDGNYDVQMEITVRLDGENKIRVKIELTRYPQTDAPFFNESILYEQNLENFSNSVSRKFLEKSKNWLIKD